MIGLLAYSLAGHDKGKIYLIINEDSNYMYVSDGDVRPLDNLKRKNRKHMQIIKKVNRKADIKSVTNEEIKYLIKLYCKDIEEEK